MEILDRKKFVYERFIIQWQESKNLIELCQGFALDSSQVEIVLSDFLTKRLPAGACLAGDPLERLAEVFGIKLQDFEEEGEQEKIRLAIYSAIAEFFGGATAKDIVSLCRGVFSLDVARVIDIYPAGFSVEVTGEIEDPATLLSTIEKMKAAGVFFHGLSISKSPAFSFAEYTGIDETRGFLDENNPETTGGYLSDILRS